MENFGLITYRTTAILFDEQQSDARYKNRVAYVVAHGMSVAAIIDFQQNGTYLSLTTYRTCPPVVWESGYNGLVERALA